MWAQPYLNMDTELLKCCCLMYAWSTGKTNECFSPDALSFGAEGHFLWVIWVRSICPPMFFLFNKCVLPFSRVSLAHFQFQFCPYPLFIDSVGFLISKFRLSINMSSNLPARGRWMLKIWSKCILNFYKGWFLLVSGVVEGVAQASNCDSVALLLDHPRLRAPPPCHLAYVHHLLVGVPNPRAPQASETGNLSHHLRPQRWSIFRAMWCRWFIFQQRYDTDYFWKIFGKG